MGALFQTHFLCTSKTLDKKEKVFLSVKTDNMSIKRINYRKKLCSLIDKNHSSTFVTSIKSIRCVLWKFINFYPSIIMYVGQNGMLRCETLLSVFFSRHVYREMRSSKFAIYECFWFVTTCLIFWSFGVKSELSFC